VSTFDNIQTNTFGFLGVLNATTAPESAHLLQDPAGSIDAQSLTDVAVVVAFRGTQSSNLENWITECAAPGSYSFACNS
jgi:hypothetical protein